MNDNKYVFFDRFQFHMTVKEVVVAQSAAIKCKTHNYYCQQEVSSERLLESSHPTDHLFCASRRRLGLVRTA